MTSWRPSAREPDLIAGASEREADAAAQVEDCDAARPDCVPSRLTDLGAGRRRHDSEAAPLRQRADCAGERVGPAIDTCTAEEDRIRVRRSDRYLPERTHQHQVVAPSEHVDLVRKGARDVVLKGCAARFVGIGEPPAGAREAEKEIEPNIAFDSAEQRSRELLRQPLRQHAEALRDFGATAAGWRRWPSERGCREQRRHALHQLLQACQMVRVSLHRVMRGPADELG